AAGEPARHGLPVLGPEPDLPPAGPGEGHRPPPGHPAARGDHRAARHAPHPLQPTRVLEAEDRRHRGRPAALVGARPAPAAGRGARRAGVQPGRGRRTRRRALRFELYQHWYMGAMATPRTAGHTGFTGRALVLDPTTDSFLVLLGNSVHPVRSWRSGSAPRVAAANNLARAVPVRPAQGRAAW